MPGLLPQIDPEGLLEFSVVYTDRALNHMSQRFQGVMKDISAILKEVYHAKSAVLVPGSGTFGMEAVARQFATDKKTLVIRNGWFSYRWTQIFDMGRIPSASTVLKARRVGEGEQAPWIPCPVDEVVATIAREMSFGRDAKRRELHDLAVDEAPQLASQGMGELRAPLGGPLPLAAREIVQRHAGEEQGRDQGDEGRREEQPAGEPVRSQGAHSGRTTRPSCPLPLPGTA